VKKKIIYIGISTLVNISCFNTDSAKTKTSNENKLTSTNPIETYKYWADTEVPENTKVLNGQYWSSIHFTKEYILYMEIKAPWFADFIRYNSLKKSNKNLKIPSDAPKWFSPKDSINLWTGEQGSLYFIDTINGHMFMYEKQL